MVWAMAGQADKEAEGVEEGARRDQSPGLGNKERVQPDKTCPSSGTSRIKRAVKAQARSCRWTLGNLLSCLGLDVRQEEGSPFGGGFGPKNEAGDLDTRNHRAGLLDPCVGGRPVEVLLASALRSP